MSFTIHSHQHFTHFFTNRNGGESLSPFHSLNLSYNTNDNSDTVKNNRRIIADKINISPDNLVFAQQIHSCNIEEITENSFYKGIEPMQAVPECDALITAMPNLALMVMAADCVPILIGDKTGKAIAAIHAGWRGTANGITPKTVEQLISKYKVNPENLLVWIGPSIGACCYTVGQEVIDTCQLNFGELSSNWFSNENSKTQFNLWQANKEQLIEKGIRAENIEIVNICTSCNTDKYFSHRAEQGITGRFAGGIFKR